jgi:hypothetical protein
VFINIVFTFCLDAGVVLVFFVRPFSVQQKGCRLGLGTLTVRLLALVA